MAAVGLERISTAPAQGWRSDYQVPDQLALWGSWRPASRHLSISTAQCSYLRPRAKLAGILLKK